MIKVRYSKVNGRCMLREPLTSGMVGQTIHFEYSHDFDGLMITAVFTDGKNTINVVNPGSECVIPHEVLTTVGATVKVGIYAVRGEELVIPTVYATIGVVLRGANPNEGNSGSGGGGCDCASATDDEIIDVLYETGIMSPVADNGGKILLADNNNILTL